VGEASQKVVEQEERRKTEEEITQNNQVSVSRLEVYR